MLAGGWYVSIQWGGCQKPIFLTMELSSNLKRNQFSEKDTGVIRLLRKHLIPVHVTHPGPEMNKVHNVNGTAN